MYQEILDIYNMNNNNICIIIVDNVITSKEDVFPNYVFDFIGYLDWREGVHSKIELRMI